MKRSSAVTVGGLAVLAGGFLAACGDDVEREIDQPAEQTVAVCAVPQDEELVQVDESQCAADRSDDHHHSSWFFIYSSIHGSNRSGPWPNAAAHSSMARTDPRAAGMRSGNTQSVPARGGFGAGARGGAPAGG